MGIFNYLVPEKIDLADTLSTTLLKASMAKWLRSGSTNQIVAICLLFELVPIARVLALLLWAYKAAYVNDADDWAYRKLVNNFLFILALDILPVSNELLRGVKMFRLRLGWNDAEKEEIAKEVARQVAEKLAAAVAAAGKTE